MLRPLTASILATVVVSALLYFELRMNFIPPFDLFGELALFNERIGLPTTERALWVTHAIIGIAIYGVGFAIFEPILPGGRILRGVWFGIIAWLVMMVAFMPLAQREIFAQDLGMAVVVTSLGLNLIYGTVLGMVFWAIAEPED